VVDGELLIDLEGRTVALKPGQGLVVPKTVVHRTRAPKRTTILMVENAGLFRPELRGSRSADARPRDYLRV